ncbi:MAG: LysR family transcriptional regulator [Paenibacillaceae bacterium]
MFSRLHTFATIVEHKSLNRASRILNVSQPALSRHVQGIENELGVALFDRRGKSLELTPAGHQLYQFALEERQLERRFQMDATLLRLERKGNITIGASLTTLQSTLPDLITHYTRTDPEIDLKAITGKTHEIVNLVKQQKVDVGLVASEISDPLLTCIPLFDDHLCLVAPKIHPLIGKANLRMEDFNDLPMILFSKGTWYRILTDELFERNQIKPEIKMEIDSFEAILRLVSTCHTATLLPKSYLRYSLLEDNDLVRLDIAELKKTIRTTSLVHVNTNEISLAAQRFVLQSKLYYSSR